MHSTHVFTYGYAAELCVVNPKRKKICDSHAAAYTPVLV